MPEYLSEKQKKLPKGLRDAIIAAKKAKEKKEKKPRAQTEYNKFVSTYINEQKEKLGSDFNHKVAFADAAKKWNEQKESKKEAKNE